MLISILCVGSRGDTQPYIALGQALTRQGYQVRIAASEAFKDFVEQYGLAFAHVRGDVTQIASSELAKDAMNADNPIKFFKSLAKGDLMDLFLMVQQDLYQATVGSDAIIYHPGAAIGYFAGQTLGIPSILASPFPMTPTGDYPSLLFYDGPRLGKLFYKLTHLVFEQGFWLMCKKPVRKFLGGVSTEVPRLVNPFTH